MWLTVLCWIWVVGAVICILMCLLDEFPRAYRDYRSGLLSTTQYVLTHIYHLILCAMWWLVGGGVFLFYGWKRFVGEV